MSAEDVSRLLIVSAPIDWLITLFVWRQAHRVREYSLSYLVGVFVMCSFIVTTGAMLGFAYLTDTTLPDSVPAIMLSAAFIVAAAVPPLWLVSYALGKFR